MLNGEGVLHHTDADGNQLDGVNLADLNISVEEFTKRLRPFHPPPPPAPLERSKNVSEIESKDKAAKNSSSCSVVPKICEFPDANDRKVDS